MINCGKFYFLIIVNIKIFGVMTKFKKSLYLKCLIDMDKKWL